MVSSLRLRQDRSASDDEGLLAKKGETHAGAVIGAEEDTNSAGVQALSA